MGYIKISSEELQRFAQSLEGADPSEKLKSQIDKLSVIKSKSIFNDNVSISNIEKLFEKLRNSIQLYQANQNQALAMELQKIINKIRISINSFSPVGVSPNTELYNKYNAMLTQMSGTISSPA